MGDGSNNDGHKKADLFVKARIAKIGTIAAPKLNQDTLTWVAENLTSDHPFKGISVTSTSKQAKQLRDRRRAFMMVQGYVDLVEDVNDQNPSCKADGVGVDQCMKVFVFGGFREILVLETMHEQVKIGGEPINPNGYFRAFAASADQIHLSQGGLSTFLTQGEPSLVSYMVIALEAMENPSTVLPPMTVSAGQFGMASFAAPALLPPPPSMMEIAKRARETTGMIQQTTPPYLWVCEFCHKPSHSANVCRLRLKEEKKQKQMGTQFRANGTTTSTPQPTGSAMDNAELFKKFEEWRKQNP